MQKRKVRGRHISKYNKLNWSTLPPGIKVLIAYTGIIAFFYFLYLMFGVTKPISILFGTFIYGTAATVIELCALALLISIIYGLVKRYYWVFYVSLFWFAFGALNAFISLLTFGSEFDVLRNILFASSFIVILLNGIIVWYVYSEKEYFRTKHLNKKTKSKDKFFVYVISAAIIVSMLILATFGLNFYVATLQSTNEIVAELYDASIPELICQQKQTQEQDLCYLILSIMKDGKEPQLCENILSDFYKITCYRALQ